MACLSIRRSGMLANHTYWPYSLFSRNPRANTQQGVLCRALAQAAVVADTGTILRGNTSVKVAPWPSSLSTWMVPPIS